MGNILRPQLETSKQRFSQMEQYFTKRVSYFKLNYHAGGRSLSRPETVKSTLLRTILYSLYSWIDIIIFIHQNKFNFCTYYWRQSIIKLIQSHSRSKVQKKVRIDHMKTRNFSQRPPASVSNNKPCHRGSKDNYCDVTIFENSDPIKETYGNLYNTLQHQCTPISLRLSNLFYGISIWVYRYFQIFLRYYYKKIFNFFKSKFWSLIYSSEEITVTTPTVKPVTENMKNNVEWELESAKLFEKSVWDVSNEANEVMFKNRNLKNRDLFYKFCRIAQARNWRHEFHNCRILDLNRLNQKICNQCKIQILSPIIIVTFP